MFLPSAVNTRLFGGFMSFVSGQSLRQSAIVSMLVIAATLFISTVVQADGRGSAFPLGPDRSMTPGSYCQTPDTYRYPEHIAYCSRDVDSSLKYQIFKDYNDKLGYRIDMRDRSKYKIDHFIPLCAGGSNQKDNLWPQHESVYAKTDAIEAAVCEKMKAGRMTQKVAVDFVYQAKLNLDQADDVLRKVLSY